MPDPVEVHLATRNAKKLAELDRILTAQPDGTPGGFVGGIAGLRIVGLDDVADYDEPVEDGATFEANALIKARAGLAATGLSTIADDSGLCVEALNGMPGVLSARWSGRSSAPQTPSHGSAGASGAPGGSRDDQDARNNRLLLDQLHDVPDERRGAHFACAIACCLSDGREVVVHGRMPGRVIRQTQGEGGFGYDSLFVADARPGLTTAQLSQTDKDAISHRGLALRELAPRLAELLG